MLGLPIHFCLQAMGINFFSLKYLFKVSMFEYIGDGNAYVSPFKIE